MLNLFKRKADHEIGAPVDGSCVDISQVNDIGFSSKVMGDGVAIIPQSDTIVAPCDGKITMVFHTGHAIGLLSGDGTEILIHAGIDTVNANGVGFKTFCREGDSVKKGTPLLSMDLQALKKEYDMSVMVIVTNDVPLEKENQGTFVKHGDCILRRKSGKT